MEESVYQKRHHYQIKDETPKKYRWRKKQRLSGAMNDVHVASNYPLIMEYFKRNTGMDQVDIETLLYLSGLGRSFDRRDFINCPNGFMEISSKAQIKRLENKGMIQEWEGHNSFYHRKKVYRFSTKGKLLTVNFDKMMMRLKKIPLDVRLSDYDFVTPRKKLENNRFKVDWHAAIIIFNKSVDREKQLIKDEESGIN